MKSLNLYLEGLLNKSNKQKTSDFRDWFNCGRIIRNGVAGRSVGASASLAFSGCNKDAYFHPYRKNKPSEIPDDFKWTGSEWFEDDWKPFGYWLLVDILYKHIIPEFGCCRTKGQQQAFEKWWDSVAPVKQYVTSKFSMKIQIHAEWVDDMEDSITHEKASGVLITFTRKFYEPVMVKTKKRIYVNDDGTQWQSWMGGRRSEKHQKTIYVDEPDYNQAGKYKCDDVANIIGFFFYHKEINE